MTPRAPGGPFPLTALQRAMVLASRQAPSGGIYVIQDVCESAQELDAQRLRNAWRGVVQRHPALATSFVSAAGGELCQQVSQDSEVPWQELDWTGVAPDEKPARLAAFLRRDWERGFEFDSGIPMRFALLRMPEHASILIWTVHHALVDGRSLEIVWREWFAFYDALAGGEPSQFVQALPFRDHVEWLLRQDFADAESYWRRFYTGISETAEYVVDRLKRPAEGSDGFGKEGVSLSAEATRALWEFASVHGVTVNNLVQGAWALLLSRYSGRPDVVFGVTRAGRHAPAAETGEMVGLLINTLPMRIVVDPGATLAPWLQGIGEQWAGLRPYEHTPLEKLREWSGLAPGMPLFDNILVYDREPPSEIPRRFGGSWSDRTLHRVQRTGVPLTLAAYGQPVVRLEIVYDQRLFARETAAAMARHLQMLLRSFVERLDCPLAELKMLPPAEEAWLVSELNRTEVVREKDLCVHQLFERQAARIPDDAAIEFQGAAISFHELNRRANRLARFLRERGARSDELIAVCMGRHPEAVVSVLAVLKAGAAFLPLDVSLPPARLARMIETAQPKLVLVWGGDGVEVPGGIEVVDLEGFRSEIAGLPSDNRPARATHGHAAYAMFTSGSTGVPKAAVIPHRALLNHTLAASRVYGITRADRRLQFASLASDMFVAEVFNYLCHGATLVFGPRERVVSVAEFLGVLDGLRISVTGVPSSWWNEWVSAIEDGSWSPPPALRAVIIGMERANPAAFLKWMQAIGRRVRLFNAYGPTEASPTTAIYEAGTSACEGGAFVPIGKPIDNVQLYVLDEHGNPVPAGVSGELYIGGDGLARGYRNAPDPTAERFVPDPFGAAPGDRLYRTGDRVFRLPDGNLEFLGRMDRQVKIRGFRVELDEVEAVLARHPAVRQSAVVVRGPEGRQKLVAYVEPAGGQTLDAGDLRLHLCRQLPGHMVPAEFAILAELPKTHSGKVDRLSLPESMPETALPGPSRCEPATAMEQRLATLWGRVLDTSSAGTTDNFFLAGGDSLRAAELLALIHREFRLELPMAALLRAPTIAGLALALDSLQTRPAAAAGDVVLEFNQNGARAPLFCISSQGDDAQCFRHLAAHLGPEQPLFALAGPDGNDRMQQIEDSARQACQAIRRLRPHGPYLLGGYCFGGIVAFECARHLIAMGEEVPMVALIDVPAPGYPRFLRRLGRRGSVLRPVAVPTVHFVARRDDAVGARILHLLADPRLGWRKLCEKPVRMVRMEASHATLLHEPTAGEIAAALEALLREASRRVAVTGDATGAA